MPINVRKTNSIWWWINRHVWRGIIRINLIFMFVFCFWCLTYGYGTVHFGKYIKVSIRRSHNNKMKRNIFATIPLFHQHQHFIIFRFALNTEHAINTSVITSSDLSSKSTERGSGSTLKHHFVVLVSCQSARNAEITRHHFEAIKRINFKWQMVMQR